MNEMQEYSDEFFKDIRPKTFEKIELKTAATATVIDVSKIKSNPKDDTGVDKNQKEFKKLFFTVQYELEEPVNDQTTIYESYGFRMYTDSKDIWYGTADSSCGKLVDVISKNIAELPRNPSPVEVKAALLGRKVKIVSEPFGPTKSMKTMILSFI